MSQQNLVSLQAGQRERDAEKYRLCQARALMELFRRDVGQPPTSLDQLNDWSITARHQRPIDPFAVLSPEEVRSIMEGD